MSMTMNEAIEQLENLAVHCSSMIDKEEPESIWQSDVEALTQVIEKLRNECVGTDPVKIVSSILEQEKLSKQKLADKMGIARQNVSQALNRNRVSMRFDNFERMVSALGYEIVARKK